MHHASGVIETIGDEHQRNNARMWTVRTYARAGDFDAALKIVRSLPVANECKGRALANVMEGLKQANKAAVKRFLPTLLQEAEAFTDPTRQALCLQGFADVLAEIGDIETTKKIAETLEMAVADLGLQDHRGRLLHDYQTLVLSALGKAQARAGNRKAALETFQKAVGLTTWMPAEQEAIRSDRLKRLVRDRVDAGDIEGALQTAALIVYEYHKAIALIEIAEAQAKSGRRDEANSLFRKAIQTAGEIKIRDPLRDRPGNFHLNSSECLRTIAFIQARAGFAEEAIQTAQSIDEPRWKDSALAEIALALAERGEIAAAVQLLPKIADEKSKTYALQAIAEGQAKTGDVQGAWDWAKSLATPEARATALLGVVRAIVKRPVGTL